MRLQQPRMKHPGYVIPEAMKALQAVGKAVHGKGVPDTTLYLIELRASQINGCSVCVEMHSAELAKAGVPQEKIFAVGAWRESPHFDDAERAALALTEAETRLADRPDPVSDEVWDFAAKHYDEQALAALVIAIAGINTWNRLNATIRQTAGGW